MDCSADLLFGLFLQIMKMALCMVCVNEKKKKREFSATTLAVNALFDE